MATGTSTIQGVDNNNDGDYDDAGVDANGDGDYDDAGDTPPDVLPDVAPVAAYVRSDWNPCPMHRSVVTP